MSLMLEKGITGGICHALHRYAKANNKYMRDYDKNKESSYLKYWDVNKLYGWARNLSLDNFRWVEEIYELNKGFLKSYNDNSHEGYFVGANVQYLENLHYLHNNLLFLPKRKKIEKIKKSLAKFHDKTEYVVHKRNLKQALNHRLVLKKWHRIIKFNQKS